MSTRATHDTDPSSIEAARWRIDPSRSSVELLVKMLWGISTVKGRFSRYHGSLDLSANPAIDLTIEAASVDTGNKRRDRHLRSSDFFDADARPYVRYVAEAATLEGERLVAHGQLHARGVTLPLSVEATLRRVGDEVEIESVTEVDYRQIGISWGNAWIKTGVVGAPGRVVVTGRLVQQKP